MKIKLVIILIMIILFAVLILQIPLIFTPKRWLEINPGIDRDIVHKILGKPDCDLFLKGFDGWHNHFYFGATVLTVRYDTALSKVISTSIKTKWGLEYTEWVQDYKREFNPNKTAAHRSRSAWRMSGNVRRKK